MSMRSITTWTFNPNEPIKLASHFAHLEGTVFFYSGGNLDSANHSFLCLFPKEKISFKADSLCWSKLKEKLSFSGASFLPEWAGYIGYEMGLFADEEKKISGYNSLTPDSIFYKPSMVIHFDHKNALATLYAEEEITIEQLVERAAKPDQKKEAKNVSISYSSDTLESYLDKIKKIKEKIIIGEVYQVNLSQEFHLEGHKDPYSVFESIARINPAPFSAFLNCKEFCIVSSSPELFLKKTKDTLQTRPIKGTVPRGKTKALDKLFKNELLSSEKERAELLMITDLMRSDLGKVSQPGTVITKDLWRCEAYRNVFHLLSIIESKSLPMHPVDLVKSLFPGGSITGCPKLSSMQIISELEQKARGIYTGSIGYFATNADFSFNIAIRTLVIHKRHLQLQLGGAIVIDSNPEKEFEETFHKGRSLFSAIAESI